jgi:hypothetical protein
MALSRVFLGVPSYHHHVNFAKPPASERVDNFHLYEHDNNSTAHEGRIRVLSPLSDSMSMQSERNLHEISHLSLFFTHAN